MFFFFSYYFMNFHSNIEVYMFVDLFVDILMYSYVYSSWVEIYLGLYNNKEIERKFRPSTKLSGSILLLLFFFFFGSLFHSIYTHHNHLINFYRNRKIFCVRFFGYYSRVIHEFSLKFYFRLISIFYVIHFNIPSIHFMF